MPISAEQWRISIGFICTKFSVVYRRNCNVSKKNACCTLWNIFCCLFMQLGDLLPKHQPSVFDAIQCESSVNNKIDQATHTHNHRLYNKGKRGSIVMLAVFFLLIILSLQLLRSGNVERNPGPYPDELTEKDLKLVRRYLYPACPNWEGIGLELKMLPHVLDRIKANNSKVEDCMTEMLKEWLRSVSPKPTWYALLNALKETTVGRGDVVDTIEREIFNSSIGIHGCLAYDEHLACVRRESWKARHKWNEIGVALKLPKETLSAIKYGHQEVEACFTEMLKVWLKQSDHDERPTWSALIDALKHVGCEDLAIKIQQNVPMASSTNATSINDESQTTDAVATTIVSEEERVPRTDTSEASVLQCSGSELVVPQTVRDKVYKLETKFEELADRAGKIVLISESKQYENVEIFRSLITLHNKRKYYSTFFGEDYLKGESTQELWNALKDHWNYLNFTLLQRVVSVVGDDDLKKGMETYAESVYKFRRTTLLCDFHEYLYTIDIKLNKELLGSLLTSKYKLEWETCTLEDLEGQRNLITCMFDLPEWSMLLEKFKKGCVSITWSLPYPIACELKVDIKRMGIDCFKTQCQILEFDFDGKSLEITLENLASFLKEKYLMICKKEKYPLEFRLAKISKQKVERDSLDDSMKPSIRGNPDDDICFLKSNYLVKDLDEHLSLKKSDTKLVLIEGAQGVGKTTFCKYFCQKWALGETMQNYSLLIFLPFREVRSATDVSHLFPWYDRSQTHKLVQEAVDNEGEGIAFWLDGWDELPKVLHKKSSIFLELIYGKILPKATIFVTSRHWASTSKLWDGKTLVDKLKRTDIHIEIFCTEEQLNFKSGEMSKPKIEYKFKAIDAAIYTRVTANIAKDVLRWRDESSLSHPSTVTQLYTMYVYMALSEYLLTSANTIETWDIHCFDSLPDDVMIRLETLCKTAFDGVKNRVFIFDDPDLERGSFGLLQPVDSVYSEQKHSFTFVHTTIQEYLAAVHISKMSGDKQAKLFQELQRKKLIQGQFQIPLRFVAGLTCLDSLDELKQSKLFSSLLKRNPLTLFHWLFETGSIRKIQKVLSNSIPKLTVSSVRSWIPLDYFVTGHCLSLSDCEWSLNFSQLSGNDELKMFFQGVISNAEISQHCTGSISRLTFKSVEFKRDDLDLLAQTPARIWHELKVLEISTNCKWPSNRNFTDVLANKVPEMSSLTELGIYSRIGPGGAVKVLRSLFSSKTLSRLDLSNSYIGEEDSEAAGELLATSTSLATFHICKISGQSVFSILKGLHANYILQDLQLSMSPFSLRTMKLLSSILENPQIKLRDLYIDECQIDVPQTIELARALCYNQSLKYLKLSYNTTLGEHSPQDIPLGVKAIADMLSQNTCLESLLLYKCGITSMGAIMLADVLIVANSALDYINIGLNRIGSKGVLKLAELLRVNKSPRFINLDYNDPSITLDDCYRLYDAMKVNTTLESIHFPRNENVSEASFMEYLQERSEHRDSRVDWI